MGAVLRQEVRPGHAKARPRDVVLGRKSQSHQRVIDVVGVVKIGEFRRTKSSFSDDQVRTSVARGGLNRIEHGAEAAHLHNREDRTLSATATRRHQRRTFTKQRTRETTRNNRTLDHHDAARNHTLRFEELADALLDPLAGMGASDEEVTALNEQGTTAVAKLSLADGGEANFTVEAEVGEDLGFDVPLVRPGFQLGRQLGRVTYGVFHIQLEASEPT